MTLHQVKPPINRARAVQEAARTLKSDGTLRQLLILGILMSTKRFWQGWAFMTLRFTSAASTAGGVFHG